MGAFSPIMPLHRRLAIEAELETLFDRVTVLLARLDHADGDCDLEDGDPDHGVDDVGEAEEWRETTFVMPAPLYAVDQSRGPTNQRQANRGWHNHFQQPAAERRPFH